MSLVANDHVVQAVAAQSSDHAFDERRLPRRSRSGLDFLDPHVLDTAGEVVTVDAVAITEKVSRSRVPWKRLDNLLRPILVGKDTQMHELMIFFGTLGGIIMFGVVGIFIGPIIAALFITVWDIYGVAFKDVLPPVKMSESNNKPKNSSAAILSDDVDPENESQPK